MATKVAPLEEPSASILFDKPLAGLLHAAEVTARKAGKHPKLVEVWRDERGSRKQEPTVGYDGGWFEQRITARGHHHRIDGDGKQWRWIGGGAGAIKPYGEGQFAVSRVVMRLACMMVGLHGHARRIATARNTKSAQMATPCSNAFAPIETASVSLSTLVKRFHRK